MMRLDASEKQHRYHNLLQDDHANEMLEGEGAGLAARVAELEVRCSRQAEELLCLRSTLADALRRLNALEGRAPTAPTGQRNGAYTGSSSTPTRELRLRQPAYRETAKRTSSYGSSGSSLPQRRGPQHQSTGSLQSDSPASSSSLSPAPSPSPRATPAPLHTPHPPQPYRSRNNSTSSNQSASPHGNSLTKRWNSTGDFGAQGLIPNNRFTTTKSLLNLYSKPSQNGSILKHGTHTCQYNEEDGSMRMYLRGRPVVLYGPSDQDALDPAKVAPPPQSKLKLEWVYGYRGKDCRSNLYLLPTGEIVYFVAAVVVLFNVDERCQRHYTGHTDDVKCLAVHPNKLVIATGQCAGHDRLDARPHVRVWNSVSLATLAVIGVGQMERAVACVTFSRADGGSLLACVDEGPDHTISVWEWQRPDKGHCLAETKCSVDTVVAAEFHPLDRNQIVTCGKNHIAFWTLDHTNMLYKRMGVFDGRDKPKYVTCLGFNHNGDVLSGDSSGNIIEWARGTNTVAKLVRSVHEGPVFSLCCRKDGSLVSAGGKDGRIVLLDAEANPTGVESVIEGHYGGVRVIAEGRGSQLFVGTTKNCILHGDLELGFSPAVLGHVDELWGLAAHPTLAQFATAGWDRLLQLWDGLSHSTVWSKDIDERAQCVSWSADGGVLAVGCLSGKWLVFDPQSRQLLTQHQDGSEPIQTIQYSPDNSMVALGSRDNFIYVYRVEDSGARYTRVGKCLGHSSYITHLDWSEDSQYIRSNSGDYELLFWNATTCRQVPSASSLRDVAWSTGSCPITFSTIGVWPENADGTDINTCTRSHDNRLAATGDDFGKVKLYAYPVTQPKSLCHQYGGHSSHVTCVRFLPDDSRLVSTGGLDTSVMQWALD
ncbi:echinoderm microtubule-associated protein-like 2 isoform X2 [Plodia interpunctella]|uniref:echinoderm microtubule-associated protein-like 2 isoform X2 n=1 Tax=Plodia interpunctella TaxID=58824 RepID=UPI002367B067|nr:echinoderm microtubule-associated protein-like 2 isoform X2 [Plodia interpunctella]